MTKSKSNQFLDTVDECLTNGAKNGIFHVTAEDNDLDGRHITIDGQRVINFGSCSYLALEVDPRLKKGAIDATTQYGTQYSASRAFSKCNLYDELEELFYQIFDNNPCVLAATTTLTHVAAIPILVQDDDLVILDHQVHGSVQMACQLTKAKGTRVEMIRHNRMDMLESLIADNPNKYNRIWYMADGLYSMYGDFAPVGDLNTLLEKYHNFHIYYDDAHSMSWTGKHGCGYVLGQGPLHPKVVVATSLAKGFGTGGGVLIVTDPELKRKILTCGTSYTFSGPVQPPMLGASIASARIHLTDEIYELQANLADRITYTQQMIDELGLPSLSRNSSPIFYLALGLPRVGYNMVKRLMNEGYYANIGIFPGVPVKCTGLRLPITNGQTHEDIKGILQAFSYHLPKVFEEEKITIDQVSKSFNVPFDETKKKLALLTSDSVTKEGFDVQHETTIYKIDKNVWNKLLGDRGTFDWDGCRFLEETFTDNLEPENNWKFNYVIIRDEQQKPILATFFTVLLCKDDMIASKATSTHIEEVRKSDKYYLTSRVVMLGSLITIGNHLFIDRANAKWHDAFLVLIQMMNNARQQNNAAMLQLRDFDTDDLEIRDFLIKEGFIRVDMPDDHLLRGLTWTDEEEFMQSLSTKARWHFRRNIIDKKNLFSIKTLTSENEKRSCMVDRWYALYLNVKNKSYEINTYTLPNKYFSNIVSHPSWEVIDIKIQGKEESVGFSFCYRTPGGMYSIVAVGLDYDYVITHGAYRQSLYQSIKRAGELNAKTMYLGMGASMEKRKFGAKIFPKSVFIQANDNFNMELMGNVFS